MASPLFTSPLREVGIVLTIPGEGYDKSEIQLNQRVQFVLVACVRHKRKAVMHAAIGGVVAI